jgi:phage shock protein A
MSYFSRLTDIVTCNLSEILAREADQRSALTQIVAEMNEGLSGARRSVQTAAAAEERLLADIAEQRRQIDHWMNAAKEHLQTGREDQARLALLRKQEVADLIAGLEQQHQAAVATREHLTTTLHALEARLADALRRQRELDQPAARAAAFSPPEAAVTVSVDQTRAQRVEAELESLKRELGGARSVY